MEKRGLNNSFAPTFLTLFIMCSAIKCSKEPTIFPSEKTLLTNVNERVSFKGF